MKDIVEIWKKQPDLFLKNIKNDSNEGYLKSLKEDKNFLNHTHQYIFSYNSSNNKNNNKDSTTVYNKVSKTSKLKSGIVWYKSR